MASDLDAPAATVGREARTHHGEVAPVAVARDVFRTVPDRGHRLAPSTRALDGMPVRSLEDLATDKTLALFGCATARDFVDVY